MYASNINSDAINTALQSQAGNSKNAQEASKGFEGLFVSMMLKAMRKTVPENGLLKKNIGESIYTDMLDNKYASIIAENADLGLEENIMNQINSDNSRSMASLSGSMNQVLQKNSLQYAATSRNPLNSIVKGVEKWSPEIAKASETYNVNKYLISAVIAGESGGNPNAVSHAGAKGLMQLMDGTAKDMGVGNAFDPKQNIMGGSKYLASMLEKYNGDENLALAAYNAGPAATDKYGGVPPYRETVNYVNRVNDYKNYMESLNEQEENDESTD